MTNLHFNFKDVFRAGRLGFSAKKMWVMFLGLVVAFVGYDIFAGLAYLAAGVTIGDVWDVFRLMPIYSLDWLWYSWILWAVGVLWWIVVTLLAGVAVSKITYEQLRGDEFYEIKEAIKFALKNGRAAILAPIVLVSFIIVLVLMGLVLALITWIPYFGQIFFALMAIPAFAVCLFIVYLMIVAAVALVMAPAIVGTTGNDTFDTLFEAFSVINDQPWRFIVYELLLKAIAVVGVFILGFFAAKAIYIGQDVIGMVVPAEKLDNLLVNAAYYVKITLPPCVPDGIAQAIYNYITNIGQANLLYPPDYLPAYQDWAGAIASFLLGIVYYLIVFFVCSLGGAINWAGNAVIFTVLVKKKDDKNLLEIKEEVFEETKEEEKPAEKKEETKTEDDKKAKKPNKKEEEAK